MKPSTRTVLFRTAILVLLVTLVESDDYLTAPNYETQLLEFLTGQAKSATDTVISYRTIKRGKIGAGLMALSAITGDIHAITNMFNTEKPYQKQVDRIKKRLDDVKTNADRVSDQIYDLETALNDDLERASHALETEIRLTHIDSFINKIDAAASELRRLMSSYTGEDLAKELIKFISSFDSREYGSCIFSGLNSGFVTLAPLVDDLITRGRNNYDGSRWSVSTMIYSTHITILEYLNKQITILEIAYIFLARVTTTLVDPALTKLGIDRYHTLEQFNKTYHNTYKKLNDEDCAQRVKLDLLQADKIVNTKHLGAFYCRKIQAPNGHVITGVRFVEKYNMIFLQIESGQLLPQGTVTEPEWRPIPENWELGDYVFMAHDKSIAVFNGLEAPKKDHFVTAISFEPYEMGVRFRSYKRKVHSFANGTLGDELYETPIKETHIGYRPVQDFWKFLPGLSDTGLLMKVTKPLGVKFKSSPRDEPKQTYIPHFDGSDIAFDLRVPLTDITFLHYTNHAKYAGYIRPLLTSIDYNYFHFLQ